VKPRPPLPDGPCLVVGLARSGIAAAVLLAARGVEVIGCDAGRPEVELPGVEAHLESDGVALLDRVATVVKSPGVPREAPVVAAARERGLTVMGELELAWRAVPNEVVAVTGTNGKTTTTELLGAIHREAGVPVAVAGNVGTPYASLAEGLAPDAVVVLEASSFQLEDALEFSPECAVLLNIEEDHLDRHGTFADYRSAKLRIFARQEPGDIAVAPAGIDPPGAAALVRPLAQEGGALVFEGEPLIATSEIRLRGRHNLENARAAAAAALARGLDPAAVARALRSFPGVRHRLEEIARIDGVLYVNDSKATNVASAIVGIEAFDGGVHAILGGSLKGGGFSGLRPAVAARCRAAYLIGEAAGRLAADLEGTGVPLHRCGELERALDAAAAAARPGEVVLLSPACASFDQFSDYEERGDRFAALVRARA
jgi:UDP-N-acetylmuramoylalanine--D-glutamate ligase